MTLIILLQTHSPHYEPERTYMKVLLVGRYPILPNDLRFTQQVTSSQKVGIIHTNCIYLQLLNPVLSTDWCVHHHQVINSLTRVHLLYTLPNLSPSPLTLGLPNKPMNSFKSGPLIRRMCFHGLNIFVERGLRFTQKPKL